jgi:hypothetical protein
MKKIYLILAVAFMAIFSYNAQAQGCADCLAPKWCAIVPNIQIPGCGYVNATICYECDGENINVEILYI